MQTSQGFPLEQVFREANLAQLGASFAEFQENPRDTLEKYGQHDAIAIMRLGYRPLLPVQVRLRETLLTQWRAEGAWEDSMLLHPASPTETNRLHQRIRQVMDNMLDLVKRRLTRHGQTAATGSAPGQAAMAFAKRHQMSHGMT
jgi:hypothetical protein